MKTGNTIVFKSVGTITAVGMFLVVLVAISTKYLSGFGWDAFKEPFSAVAIIFFFIAVSFPLIWFKFRPLARYHKLRQTGGEIDPQLLKQCFELAYGFPLAAAWNTILIALIGGTVVLVDLHYDINVPWKDAIYLIPADFVYFMIGGTVVFYLLKRFCRPLLKELSENHPEILLGKYERSYSFPFLIVIRKTITLKFPVFWKLLTAMLLLGLAGILFFTIGYRELGFRAAQYPPDSETWKALTSAQGFFGIVLLVQAVFSIGISLVLAVLVGRDVHNPIKEIIRASEAIAGGDLRDRARVISEDEFSEMAAAVNRTTEGLASGLERRIKMLESEMETAEQIAARIREESKSMIEVAGGLSKSSGQQKSSVKAANERASELGQFTGTIATRTQQIELVLEESLDACRKGSMTVQEMVITVDVLRQNIHRIAKDMEKMVEQAGKIRGVVDLIEEISDQIGLLSLNAALEAAGAGTAGRRFNTVAEEIKNLAERTTQSTGHISRMMTSLSDSAQWVSEFAESNKVEADNSVKKMEDVGTFLMKIINQVERVSQQGKQITEATDKQNQSATSLFEQLRDMQEASQKVDSVVMEVRKSLDELDKIAEELGNRDREQESAEA